MAAVKIDPAVAEAYTQVRKTEGNDWLLMTYKDNNNIELAGTGTGGVNAMKAACSEDNCYFGYVRCTIEVDETKRDKFALITFKGSNASVMRKGRMSVHIATVKQVVKDFTVEIQFDEMSLFTEEAVLGKIKSSNY